MNKFLMVVIFLIISFGIIFFLFLNNDDKDNDNNIPENIDINKLNNNNNTEKENSPEKNLDSNQNENVEDNNHLNVIDNNETVLDINGDNQNTEDNNDFEEDQPQLSSGVIYETQKAIDRVSIYENNIAWGENGNIYYMNIYDKKPIQVTSNDFFLNPLIHKNYIIAYYASSDKCVFLYNILTEEFLDIGENLIDCRAPTIYDKKIVWTSYVGGHYPDGSVYMEGGLWTIHIYDIDTKTTKNIETNIEPLSWAPITSIYDSKIVWKDRCSNSWCAYVYDLEASKKSRLNGIEANSGLSIYKNKIIYVYSKAIYLFDLSTQEITKLTTKDAEPIDFPTINENFIFFVDIRNGFNNHDIYKFDLNEMKEKEFSNLSDCNERDPFVKKDKLVYIRSYVSPSSVTYQIYLELLN